MPRQRASLDVNTLLRAPEKDWPRFSRLLQSLPSDVTPELAVEAAMRHVGGNPPNWYFGRESFKFPASVLRAILARLEADTRPSAYFLREAVPLDAPDVDLCAAWKAALLGLRDLDLTYPLRSKQRQAKLQGLANAPLLLQGIQTAVVACEKVSFDMLAVLTVDASEASLDALIPHVERAAQSQGWALDRLEDLRAHARSTPALDELFARVEALLKARRASSPALDLARHLGFGDLDTFWFKAYYLDGDLSARESDALVHHCHIDVDSRAPLWLRVWQTSQTSGLDPDPWSDTHFDNNKVHFDKQGLGACSLMELPAWLARVTKQLDAKWDLLDDVTMTSLRGKKRARLGAWLASGGG